MNSELHLFIIWEKGRKKEKEIIEDIKKNFNIIKIYEVEWTKNRFHENLTRFYGENLPKNSNKEKHCGKGPFLLILVEDKNPIYRIRKTSKGIDSVNINMFDSKEMYRFWTGGGHKIHATNSLKETSHDLVLLLGINVEEFREKYLNKESESIEKIKKNIEGADGWKNWQRFLYVLNASIKYVVLRNFEDFPENYISNEHGDVDILTESYENMKYISNSKEVFKNGYRVQNKVKIENQEIFFDFRYLGDNYYDLKWEEIILNKREYCSNNFYKIDEINYFYSLLYHALIHKDKISKDYKKKLIKLWNNFDIQNKSNADLKKECSLFKELNLFLEKNKFKMVEPIDYSVFYNKKYTKKRMSNRKIMLKILNNRYWSI